MIIKHLCDYYDVLLKEEKIPVEGYSQADKVGYAIQIANDGKIKRIVDLRDNKKPKSFTVPLQDDRTSGILSFFLCDKSDYLLGVSFKNKQETSTEEHFNVAKKLHLDLLKDIDDEDAQAICNYFKNNTLEELKQKLPEGFDEKLVFVFMNSNSDYILPFFKNNNNEYVGNQKIKQVWEKIRQVEDKNSYKTTCLISGEEEVIATNHNPIKNYGAAAKSYIVSFNQNSFESYGKKSGYNSPIGESSMFKYTSTLSYLFNKDNNQVINLADTKVIFFASKYNEKQNNDINLLFNLPTKAKEEKDDDSFVFQDKIEDKNTQKEIFGVIQSINQGINPNLKEKFLNEKLGEDTDFSIIGFTNNTSRLSISFYYRNTFHNLVENVAEHFKHLELDNLKNPYPTLYNITRETINKDSTNDKPSSALVAELFKAILNNSAYPQNLFTAVINRIRIDAAKGKSMSSLAVAIIKAYLIRKLKQEQQEELTLSLNEKSTNIPYTLGRIFAYLEKTQDIAHDGPVNAGVKEKYFGVASIRPAKFFSILMSNHQKHLKKKEKETKWLDIGVSKLINLIDEKELPKQLKQEEQGLFILGYYHQRQSFFTKKEDTTTENQQ
ncbi:MAG: type I-C CRISPR-associated protein Cas8c/Csd1 [Alphaproteobacteria bacterium]|jgi:CRISPR-associated protein Csd1|nr:type I-C CRISPR-associated protein Cas8c/Csd1 [Alphaproteobacteria bacterium]